MGRRTSKKNEEEVMDFTSAGMKTSVDDEDIREALRDISDRTKRFNEIMTFQMPKTTGHCSICNMRLTYYFPKDFPKEWKFCCICLEMANKIVNGTLIAYSWMDYRIHKILEIINIVEGK